MKNTILERWEFHSQQAQATTVFPDGCRDVIVTTAPGRPSECFTTELDTCARKVALRATTQYRGWRLQPGVLVNEAQLKRVAAGRGPDRLDSALIAECCVESATSQQLLKALAASPSLSAAAKQCGLSVRSLQRHTPSLTGRSPSFWLRLARVRKAATALITQPSLAAVAAQLGFADQAHMSREFRVWFNVTPSQVQRQHPATAGLVHSGFASD